MMHEGHFTEQIVETVIEEIKKHPKRVVESVTVKVGEVFHLVIDSVLMHFELQTKGTPLEGVKLILLEDPMLVFCSKCGKQGPVEDHHLLLCSYCYSQQVKPIAGDKVTIERILLKI